MFGDPKELNVLNEIVHPAVKEEVNKKIKKEERKNTNLLIVESAVLVEDHYNEICDELCIYMWRMQCRNRLYYSRGYDNKKIDEIIAAQLPKEMFLKACDRVIDNSGIFAETMIQIDQIVKEL